MKESLINSFYEALQIRGSCGMRYTVYNGTEESGFLHTTDHLLPHCKVAHKTGVVNFGFLLCLGFIG